METPSYFERMLFYDRSPSAEEYYLRSAESIFEKETSLSKIEVRVQSSIDASYYDKGQETAAILCKKRSHNSETVLRRTQSQSPLSDSMPNDPRSASKPDITYTVNVDDACNSDDDQALSLSSRASSTALATGLDQRQGFLPPVYPGPPQLKIIDLRPSSLYEFTKQTKHDFRVFYIRQRNSYSRLQITRELFEELLHRCHVFHRFNDYVIGFGTKHNETMVGPPALTFRPLYERDMRRYRGFECSYVLQYIEFTNRPAGKFPWSLRKFAVYHRYKSNSGLACSTWILVGASQRTETRLDAYTRRAGDLRGTNPFELHVVFIDTAMASWQPYLEDLAMIVGHQSDKATGVEIEGEDDLIPITFEDHQELKMVEDRVADLILCLDSTLDTIVTFKEMYGQFSAQKVESSQHSEVTESACAFDAVELGLRRREKEVCYLQKQARVLMKKVQTTRSLISSLLEQKNGFGTNKQLSAVRKLVEQSQEENALMREIAEKNSRDSSSMRILTIITMIYLPCTIVSNFFSTQFVKQIDTPSGGTVLGYAQNAWLFFAISVPLTLLTIGVWYLWVNGARILHNMCNHQRAPVATHHRRTNMVALKESLVQLPR